MRLIFLPIALLGLATCAPEALQPGTLLLGSLQPDSTDIEAVITANPDCTARADGYVSTLMFPLPPNGTRIIAAPPGADVCWRRDRDPNRPRWLGWNRAYLSPGRTMASTL